MEKVKTITESELAQIRKHLDVITEAQLQVGQLETRKQELLAHITMAQKELNSAQAELKEKYGEITVNIQTGEIKQDEPNP